MGKYDFNEPWEMHPDSELPINDLPDDGKPIAVKPF